MNELVGLALKQPLMQPIELIFNLIELNGTR